MDRRTEEGARVRLCVQGYLARTKQSDARVVPLTGDASDRRYFRVQPADAPPFVMAVHAQPFDVKSLPFMNVANLFATMGVPVPAITGHAADLGVLALEEARRPRKITRACIARPSASSRSSSAAAPSSSPSTICRTRFRSTPRN
jgi:aminoglycoside/choline kinase family phosphotransferase